jgi:hypothetical protein
MWQLSRLFVTLNMKTGCKYIQKRSNIQDLHTNSELLVSLRYYPQPPHTFLSDIRAHTDRDDTYQQPGEQDGDVRTQFGHCIEEDCAVRLRCITRKLMVNVRTGI